MGRKIPYITIKQLLSILFGIYFYLNVALLLWAYISPEGILSGIWFLILLHVIVVSFFVVWEYLDRFLMATKIGKGGALVRSLFLMVLFGSLIYVGPFLIFSWKIQDRYTMIQRSERLFKKGEYDKAIELAQKKYFDCKSQNYNVKPFFYFAYHFENSEYNKARKDNLIYQSLVNLALCTQAKGNDLEGADQLYIDAINFSNLKFTGKKEYLIFPLIGRFNISLLKGNTIKAEKSYSQLSDVFSTLGADDIFYKTQALWLYAKFIESRGDIAKAMLVRKEALDIYEFNPRGGTFYASLLIDVAKDLINIEQFEVAESKLKICGDLLEDKENQIIYLSYLTACANLSAAKGKEQEAETKLLEVYNSIRKIKGISIQKMIEAKGQLAALHYTFKRFEKASVLFNELLEESKHVEITPNDYIQFLFYSSLSDYQYGDRARAHKKANEIFNLYSQFYLNDFPLLPANEKESLLHFWENKIDFLNFLSIKDSLPSFQEKVYDNVLMTKSLVLESNREILKYISDDPSLEKKYNALLKAKAEIDKFNFSPEAFHLKQFDRIDSVRRIESKLIADIVKAPDFQHLCPSISWRNIRNTLSKDEVAIEIINLPTSLTNENDRKYYALIIGSEFNRPEIIPLVRETEILKYLSPSNADLGSEEMRIDAVYNKNREKLYNLIWKPLKKYISKNETTYLSVSGVLHQVSFNAITVNDGNPVEILTSTRNLIKKLQKQTELACRSAIVYGNIDYDSIKQPPFFKKNDKRGRLMHSVLDPLPGTKFEIYEVDSILRKNGYTSSCFELSKATEESFRGMNQKAPEVLHIATHGYYQSSEKLTRLTTQNNDIYSSLEGNPLFRSGLYLAGANNNIQHLPEHDGIVDAYEISLLDFSGMDLVVLSACESGLGDIKGVEGVFGLQRAFKLAGVNDIIVSLWKVPDKETSILMSKFYHYHYQQDFSKNKALKMAQKYVRENINANPFYWGAFQLIN